MLPPIPSPAGIAAELPADLQSVVVADPAELRSRPGVSGEGRGRDDRTVHGRRADPELLGIRRREDIAKNLEHLESLTHAAFWLSNLDIPVRLIAIPESALQGFNDEVLDVDHAEFARTCAIDIPGPEADRLGRLARRWGVFLIAQAKARHEDWPDRFAAYYNQAARMLPYYRDRVTPHMADGMADIDEVARHIEKLLA